MGVYAEADVQDFAEFKQRKSGHKRRAPAQDDLAETLRAASIEQAPRSLRPVRIRSSR